MVDISFSVELPNTDRFNPDNYLKKIIDQQKKSGEELKLMFQQTVEGWDKRPDFKVEVKTSLTSASLSVYPTGPNAETYNLVSKGASAHSIRPRSSRGLLRFQPGYRAATSPGRISSRAKQRFGPYESAEEVRHPGFEARNFAKTISELYMPIFLADMQEAMKVK